MLTNLLPDLAPTETIKSIIYNIDKLNWNRARELWIINVMNYKQNLVQLFTFHKMKCQNQINAHIEFVNSPNLIYIESGPNITLDEITQLITINKINFHLLCTTLHKPNHFVGIFELNGQKYAVDDLDNRVVLLHPFNALNHKRGNKMNRYFTVMTSHSMYYSIRTMK